ncbi:uncharacterized protein V6R79_018969 [Siganus canaliculatus]
MIHFLLIILMALQISVECVENPTGICGVVVYGDKTLPLSPQTHDAEAQIARLCRGSVRPFQFACDTANTTTDNNQRQVSGRAEQDLEDSTLNNINITDISHGNN